MRQTFDLLIVLLIILIGFAYSTRLLQNWDNIGYLGAILELESTAQDLNHKIVYDAIKDQTTPSEYDLIENGSKFRQVAAQESKSYAELVPAYRFKILYVLFSYGIYKTGVPLAKSTGTTSIIFFVLTLLLFYYISRQFWLVPIFWVGLATIALATSPMIQCVATLATPDMMSAFFLLLASYLYLIKSKDYTLVLVLVLTILTRPENVIFSFFLVLVHYSSGLKLKDYNKLILSLVVLSLAFFFTKYICDYPGWSVWFYHAFIERLNYPLSDPQKIDFILYVKTVLKRSVTFIFPGSILLGILLLFQHIYKHSGLHERTMKILLVLCFSIGTRFILFPYWDIRFFFYYLLILIIVLFYESDKVLLLAKNTSRIK